MERTLFLADRPLFSFSFDASGKFSVTKIHEEDLSFWPHLLQKDQSPELCKEWLGNRIPPVGTHKENKKAATPQWVTA
ncbi:MAG: hypothetical protein IJT42_02410 [Treponema sp.]|nr:hypothetical protein [Treponema sp.]